MDKVLFHCTLICVLLISVGVRVSLGVGVEIDSIEGATGRGAQSDTWCYEEAKCDQANSGSDWEKGVCKDGKRQSPINLPANLALVEKVCSTLDLSSTIDKYNFREFTAENKGVTIYVKNKEGASQPQFTWSEGIVYEFEQFHFHWGPRDDLGSEHSISGKSYPMELHLVHFHKKHKNVGDAVGKGLAVLGLMLEVGATTDSFLKPIVDMLNSGLKAHDSTKQVSTNGIDLSKVIKEQTEAYHYDGSLTTPAGTHSCAEEVKWFVFRKPVLIKKEDVEAFREVQTDATSKAKMTYRKLQKLHGRNVQVIKVKV